MKIDRKLSVIIGTISILAVGAYYLLGNDGQKKVRYLLKDPSTAEFRNSKKGTVKQDSRIGAVYCGEVNSKNSYGGLTGFKKYVVIDDAVVIEGDEAGAIYDAEKTPMGVTPTDTTKATHSANILSSKLILQTLKTKAETEVLKQKNEDRRNGIDVDNKNYGVTAFDVAWEEYCI